MDVRDWSRTMTAVDLTPVSIATALSGRRRARAWTLGVSGYAAVLVAALGTFVMATPRSEGVRARVERVQGEVEQGRKDLALVSGELTRLQRELDAARAVGEHPDWSIMLGLVAGVREGRDVVLEHARLTPVMPPPVPQQANRRRRAEVKVQDPPVPVGYQVVLSGLSRTELDASKFALGLEDVGAFDRVTLVSTRARPIDGVTFTAFEIRIDMKDAASVATEAP
jgi:hypothetical protein